MSKPSAEKPDVGCEGSAKPEAHAGKPVTLSAAEHPQLLQHVNEAAE